MLPLVFPTISFHRLFRNPMVGFSGSFDSICRPADNKHPKEMPSSSHVLLVHWHFSRSLWIFFMSFLSLSLRCVEQQRKMEHFRSSLSSSSSRQIHFLHRFKKKTIWTFSFDTKAKIYCHFYLLFLDCVTNKLFWSWFFFGLRVCCPLVLKKMPQKASHWFEIPRIHSKTKRNAFR